MVKIYFGGDMLKPPSLAAMQFGEECWAGKPISMLSPFLLFYKKWYNFNINSRYVLLNSVPLQ